MFVITFSISVHQVSTARRRQVCVYETLRTLRRAECFLTPVGLGLSQWNRKVSSAQASEPEPVSQPDLNTLMS
ncbi:hypothetical protein R3I93_000421 [Phoxinus phoxinus]|uniref:Uncharacterized protein n=1 Tax=Phoxinus phoxinus TaxID=58324 RepID=A0AAN9DMD0_9TELE